MCEYVEFITYKDIVILISIGSHELYYMTMCSPALHWLMTAVSSDNSCNVAMVTETRLSLRMAEKTSM